MDSQNTNDLSSSKVEESPPEKVLSSGIQLRASARVSKKLRLDQEQALVQAQSPEKKGENSGSNGLATTEEKRRRRAPVLWSADDKAAFFEALNEHGKNFDAIEKYMLSRAKKRGDGATKNREKARYFYYRAWHKLSRYVQFPPNIKKVTQELYALINFGELRKKLGHITEKNSQKLNELIYSGRTQVRVRGKTWRIKTPLCRALRRLNNLEDDCEEVRLPTRVEVLLTPRTNRDSVRARTTGHNPRVRAVLGLDTSLSSLVTFLGKRWSTPAQRGELRIGPKSTATITHPQYKCGQAVTSASVSLLSHVQRLGGEVAEVQSLLDQLHAGKTKGTIRKEKEGAVAIEDVANTEFMDPLISFSSINLSSVEQPQTAEDKEVDKEEFSALIKDGWNEETSVKTRIGQLYLMIGSKGVIEMEYWWNEDESTNNEVTKALQRLVSLARIYHFKLKVECPCGHKCKNVCKPGSTDSGKAVKRPLTSTAKKQLLVPDIKVSNMSNVTPKVEITRATEDIGVTITAEQPSTLVPGTFKHPLLPAPIKQHNSTLNTLKQLQTFRPKFCNRRGRSRSRGVFVQRLLPLLPKSTPKPVMVALKVIAPSSSQQIPVQVSGEVKDSKVDKSIVGTSIVSPKEGPPLIEGSSGVLPKKNGTSTSITNFVATSTEDAMSSNTFRGILGSGSEGDLGDVTPPTSPSRILKEGESQWLNSEVTDFSLSSFLGHLESPLKSNGATSSDDIQISTDVESHFQSLMTESSLDYTAKFADLAEKIAGGAGPHAC
ncbi:protein cramped isoform X2 [Halyomorpha halys]|uniref:protein cramped isoform X2 n=1 Tax=Halyomorpha halys TaxID=286706 RepID=UPI0006D517F9|nr:protein cramped isoform X2 [Halyomorpha halys]